MIFTLLISKNSLICFALLPAGLLVSLSCFRSVQQNFVQCKFYEKDITFQLLEDTSIYPSSDPSLHRICFSLFALDLFWSFIIPPLLLFFLPHSFLFFPLLLVWRACKQTSLKMRANSLSRRSVLCVLICV